MDRSPGLSSAERQRLLDQIEELLGDSPKARMVREIVERLPSAEDSPAAAGPTSDVPEAD